MDKQTALSICRDFHPVECEGGVRCRHYADHGICRRPEYLRCELVMYREQQERQALTSTVSVSRVGAVLNCPRQYALNYVYRVKPPVLAKWKIVGRAFSDARAKIDLGLQYELKGDINSNQVDKAKLSAVLRRYAEWKLPTSGFAEVRVFFPYKDTNFIGYIDWLNIDRDIIVEWKYAATEYDEIKSLRQAATYFQGIPEAQKFVLARVKKPMQKLKQAGKPTKKNPEPHDEVPFELEKRIYEELAGKKDELFTYITYDREMFDIPATLEQIYQASKLISAYEAASWPPAFGMTCENCDFRPYCLKHLTEIGCSRGICSHPLICNKIREVKQLPEADRLLLASNSLDNQKKED